MIRKEPPEFIYDLITFSFSFLEFVLSLKPYIMQSYDFIKFSVIFGIISGVPTSICEIKEQFFSKLNNISSPS